MMRFIEELAARRRFGMKPGLETITALAHALGDPQRRFKAIHIAGTNGKGAVSAMLDACLPNCGRYTSPHLVKLNERFFLRGRPVDDATLERLSSAVTACISPTSTSTSTLTPTFFEALTAVAFLLYAESKVDYAILETGLGGRLDATNICEPKLTIITKIGLDHCDWLGSTEEAIAAEKAGILKPGVPIVLGMNSPAVLKVVKARADEVGAPFYYAPELADESDIPSDFSLEGEFNRENAITAIAALKVLGEGDLKGLNKVAWPGRFQRVGAYLIDGAHNPPGARALAASLKNFAPLNLIFGACSDKDVSEVLRTLKPFVKKGFAVKTNNPRSCEAAALAAKMREAGIDSTACASLAAALEATKDEPTLICGSLFLVGEALVALNAFPWDFSRFDPSERLVL